MASISIPWNDGPGNIVLTYTGHGNGTVTVTSDTDNIVRDRRQTVTFVVQNGAIRHEPVTASGHLIRTSDGNIVQSLDNSMKVSVTVYQPVTGKPLILTASDNIVVTASGNIVRLTPSA
jgi:hypothetical protein